MSSLRRMDWPSRGSCGRRDWALEQKHLQNANYRAVAGTARSQDALAYRRPPTARLGALTAWTADFALISPLVIKEFSLTGPGISFRPADPHCFFGIRRAFFAGCPTVWTPHAARQHRIVLRC